MEKRCRFARSIIRVLLLAELLVGVSLYLLGVFAYGNSWIQEIVIGTRKLLASVPVVWNLSVLFSILAAIVWLVSSQKGGEQSCVSVIAKLLTLALLLPWMLVHPLIGGSL